MDWFRPAVSSILLLGLALALFFTPGVARPLEPWLAGTGAVVAFTLARVALLLAAAWALARYSARDRGAALVVAAPAVVIGGLMGVAAALRPIHLAIVAALVAAVVAACLLGARGRRDG